MPNLPNFPIPSVINPEKTRCLCIEVPDNDDWVQIFVGLLAMPTYWFNWQRTGDNSGSQSAKVWTDLFYKIDWGTMSCCGCPDNIYSFTNQLLNNQIALQLQQMDTGTVASYAPNAPDTTFSTDSRDSTTEQQTATKATLCLACDQWIRQVLGEQLNGSATTALEAAAVGAAVGLINPIAGVLVTLVGALPYATWLAVANDSDAIHQVKCKLYNALKSATPTYANFESSIDSATYTNANATTLNQAVDIANHNEQNFRAFMVYLQVKTSGDSNPCDDCDTGCMTNWSILVSGGFTFGTEVSKSSTEWVIQAVQNTGDGRWYVAIQSDDIANCCIITSNDYTQTDYVLWYCNEAFDSGGHYRADFSNCINQALFSGTISYQLHINFGGC